MLPQMTKSFIYVQVGLTLVLELILLAFDAKLINMFGLFLGSAIGLLNAGSLIWAMGSIFIKKSIALAVGVIVFKWSIIGALIYLTMKSGYFSAVFFVLGLSVSVLSILLVAFKVKKG